MRIAVVANTSWYVFNFRANLIHALTSLGHDVIAVAPRDSYSEKFQELGITYVPFKLSGSGTNPLVEIQAIGELSQIFKSHRIELILSYTPKGNLYSGIASMVSGSWFVPNVSGLGRVFIKKTLITHVVSFLYRFTFKRARQVFFQNNDDLNLFVENGFIQRSRAERLPGSGVDLNRFQIDDNDHDNVHSRDESAPIFLLVARMLWDKGVGEYVQAARKVKDKYPNARFQLLGFADNDNPSAIPRSTLEEWILEGVVEYLGSTDDVRPFIRASDCVVLPSYREGVPRTLLEAAALARPVITTNVPGCRDVVIVNKTGFMCNSHDPIDLEKKVLQFILLNHQGRLQLGTNGRAYIEAEFDEKIVLNKYLDLVSKFCTKSI